uniref:Ig-like domain-containing protein n=1 Tax=Callorhinchus milii TaxID=7868 RepID=A0A4W3HN14_CALMI
MSLSFLTVSLISILWPCEYLSTSLNSPQAPEYTGISYHPPLNITPSPLLMDVRDDPALCVSREGETVTLNCYQNNKDYEVMLWYLQPHQGGLTLLGYVYYTTVTHEESGYNITKTSDKMNSTLEISSVNPTQEGVYYCAAREGHSVRERQISRT